MTAARSWFSIDVDNTLLNNDRVQMTFCSILSGEFGAANRQRYWRYSRSCERNLVMPTIWARVNGCKPRAKKRSDQAEGNDNDLSRYLRSNVLGRIK
jgi:hypothetical protein